jgi:ribonucleoside-diphosphate reductase alpha chain
VDQVRRHTGEKKDRFRARDLMKQIAEATWQCGDPGMQFDTTINRWHPCKNTSRINASNPCSEYMFLDDSACNLSSLNLMKFVGPNGQFDVEAFRHGVDTLIVAQEILVDNAAIPPKDRAEFARLPAAGSGLRQSGRAADVVRHPL